MSWYVGRSLDQLLNEINASAPNRSKASDGSIGDANHSSRESDHNPCDCHRAVCARDFTHDPGGGFDSYAFANWLAERTKGPENRVKYIISNGRIASGQGQSYPAGVWRTYTGSNPHDHHCHVSVRHGPELFDNTKNWAWSGGGTVPEIGAEQMFCIIRYQNGWCYRFNGINRVHIPDANALGGDQIILAALGMDNKIFDVDKEWGDTFPEAHDNSIHWNVRQVADAVGVPPSQLA